MTDRAKDRLGELVDGVKGSFISIHAAVKEAYQLGRAYENKACADLVENEHKECLPLMCETAMKIRSRLSGTEDRKA